MAAIDQLVSCEVDGPGREDGVDGRWSIDVKEWN